MKKYIYCILILMCMLPQTAKPINCTLTLPDEEISALCKSSAYVAIGAATTIIGFKLAAHSLQQDSEKRFREQQKPDRKYPTPNMPGYLIRNCIFGVGLVTLGFGMLSYSAELAHVLI